MAKTADNSKPIGKEKRRRHLDRHGVLGGVKR